MSANCECGALWGDPHKPHCRTPSPVNPPHYRQHPSGLECIEVTEHLSFCEGNAVKYLWRHSLKNGRQDLEKAQWYLKRALAPSYRNQDKRAPLVLSALGLWADWYTNHDKVHTTADGAINEILQGRIGVAALLVGGMLE